MTDATSPKKRAVGVYLMDAEGRVLLTQRGPKARHEHFTWEGPGGAVEDGETYEQAAAREMEEELGITDLTITKLLGGFDDIVDSRGTQWESKIFSATTAQQPVIKEPGRCVGFGWFTKEEVKSLNLATYSTKDFKILGWL